MSFAKQNSTGSAKNDSTTLAPFVKEIVPAFDKNADMLSSASRASMREAIEAWLSKSQSPLTRVNYARDLRQFCHFVGVDIDQPEELVTIRPAHVAQWRDALKSQGLANATILRKMTVLRSLFSYLQVYGYLGANPAHSKFVRAPSVPRDGKTVGLSSTDCRRLLDAPNSSTPAGIRDRAMLAVLAYSACRVGELVVLSVDDLRTNGEHRVLSIYGKGGKERSVPLHIEAVERLTAWFAVVEIAEDRDGPLFRPVATPRGFGRDGFIRKRLTTRAVENLVRKYTLQTGLDPVVTVHSLRVTALTTARERGADIIDLQDFAGHADPRTTLSYIRSQDRLSKSPAYVLRY